MEIWLFVLMILIPILLSYFGTLAMRRIGQKYKIIDVPSHRSSHDVPTLRGGGLVIAITFLVLFLLSPLVIQVNPTDYWGLMIGGLAMAVLGFVDDLRSLRKTPRIIVMILITLVSLAFGIILKDISIPLVGNIHFRYFWPITTFLWLIGFTNFFNFMDGINGIAVFETLSISGFIAVIGYIAGNEIVFYAAVVLFAAALGFLPHNFPNARIFLGDSGSYFLGFTIATIGLIGNQSQTNHIPFLSIFILCSLFIFDAAVTLIRRIPKGKGWLEPHREHYYQRLTALGLSHGQVTLFYFSLNLLLGVLAVAYFLSDGSAALIYLVSSLVPFLVIVIVTTQLEKRAQLQ